MLKNQVSQVTTLLNYPFSIAYRDTHDKMLDVFQNIPSHLMLVFRNLNIIRSIIRDHGCVVDRHRIMARSAVKGYFVKPGSGLVSMVRGSWHLFVFDIRLMVDWATTKLAGLSMAVFKWLGYTNPLETIMAAPSSSDPQLSRNA